MLNVKIMYIFSITETCSFPVGVCLLMRGHNNIKICLHSLRSVVTPDRPYDRMILGDSGA